MIKEVAMLPNFLIVVTSTPSIQVSMSENIKECITPNFHEVLVDPIVSC